MATLRFPTPLHFLRSHPTRPRPTVSAGSFRSGTDSDPYVVLGLRQGGVSEGEIRQAYRNLARRLHPDVAPEGETEEYRKRFVELSWAYGDIMDQTAERKERSFERNSQGRVFKRWETDQCW